MLGFLEKLTVSPGEIVPADVEMLLRQGLSEEAIADAIYVCVGFNIINRLADAFNVKIPPPGMFSRAAKFLLVAGYQVLSGLELESIRRQRFGNRQFNQIKSDNESATQKDKFDFYADIWRQLNESVFEGPAFLEPALRKAAGAGGEMPAIVGVYVKKVARHAYQIIDEDIDKLKEAGYSEEQIFEITVCAALGAGRLRLESGLNAFPPAGFP